MEAGCCNTDTDCPRRLKVALDSIFKLLDLLAVEEWPNAPTSLALALNASVATWFTARSPAAMMGKCDQNCASKHWKALGGTGAGFLCQRRLAQHRQTEEHRW